MTERKHKAYTLWVWYYTWEWMKAFTCKDEEWFSPIETLREWFEGRFNEKWKSRNTKHNGKYLRKVMILPEGRTPKGFKND